MVLQNVGNINAWARSALFCAARSARGFQLVDGANK
jgi:hypothetical protein